MALEKRLHTNRNIIIHNIINEALILPTLAATELLLYNTQEG